MIVRTFLPDGLRAASRLLLLSLLLSTACSDSGPDGSVPTTVLATPRPSPSPSAPPAVEPSEIFEGVAGYRFVPGDPKLRARAEREFDAVLEAEFRPVALKRALLEQRGQSKGPVPELIVVVLSFELPNGTVVEGFQSAVVESLSQQADSDEIDLGGYPAYVTERATPREQSRVFFFYEDTALVQIFGKQAPAVRLAERIIEAG